jgi:hypothetical protein
MAAGTAALRGHSVTLYERNARPARKLNITGKGRCNLTNLCGREDFFAHIVTNPKFLYSAYAAFPPESAMAFFEELGVPLVVERGSRVFPASGRSYDVTDALVRWAQACGAAIKTAHVPGVLSCNSQFQICENHYDAVILATGGMSYPATGSTGDGYTVAASFGHAIVPPKPSLVPLHVSEPDCKALEGLSLRNVGLKAVDSTNRTRYGGFGELVFTDTGVSGPLILSASAHTARLEDPRCTIFIDLKPALDAETLDARIVRECGEGPNRTLAVLLRSLLPERLIPPVLAQSGLGSGLRAHHLTKPERIILGETLKSFRLSSPGSRPIEEAVVTAGGVDVREVDPKTMESKRVKGLFFAGEILDLDAYTGGFNLQIAWSTGYAAGANI